MSVAAEQAIRDRRQVINAMAMVAGSDIGQACDIVACPLIVEGRLIGSVCMEMTARAEGRQRAASSIAAAGV